MGLPETIPAMPIPTACARFEGHFHVKESCDDCRPRLLKRGADHATKNRIMRKYSEIGCENCRLVLPGIVSLPFSSPLG